jgi:hypothetical protein
VPIPIIDGILGIGEKLIDKLIPDPQAKATAILKLKELEQAGELAQLNADLQVIQGQVEVNKIEAASPNIFIAGWRPFVGWVLGCGLAVMLVLGPLMAWGSALAGRPIKQPEMPTEVIMCLSTSLLGLAGMRSWEKKNNVEGNR